MTKPPVNFEGKKSVLFKFLKTKKYIYFGSEMEIPCCKFDSFICFCTDHDFW